MAAQFAKYHENWTVEDWKRFYGQMKPKSIGWVRWKGLYLERKGEPLSDRTTSPTVKHGGGGNLMVWGCMGWNGVGKLIEVQGTWIRFNTVKFWKMELRKVLKSWRWWMASSTFSKIMIPNTCLDWLHSGFEDNNIQVLGWPFQSPDMNPLETPLGPSQVLI